MEGCVGSDETCSIDPKCATNEEINTWLQGKKLVFKSINNHADIAESGIDQIQNEVDFPSIPIEGGRFTESGYLFRKHIMKRWDNIMRYSEKKFYEVKRNIDDAFHVKDDFKMIARIQFRIDGTQMNQERQEYDYVTFLGNIGGIYELFLGLMIFILGGFLTFNATVEMIKEL